MTVMGMAASQARFLGLTARKSNVEYQGQQINQQRTALSNESANLYNQMLELDVPTPPATSDYYKTTYVLDDSSGSYSKEDYQIANLTKTYNVENEYLVTLKCKREYVDATNEKYIIGNVTRDESSNIYTINLVDHKANVTTPLIYDEANTDAYTGSSNSLNVNINQIYKALPNKNLDGYDKCCTEKDTQYYFYQDASGKNRFLTQAQLDDLINPDKKNTGIDIATTYTYKKEESTQVRATLETSDSGRYSSIVIARDDENYPMELNNKTFSLSAKQEMDQNAYDDAYNDYEYKKNLYEQEISKINAQTEIIQSEDQQLELRLQQLNTEQNAIATEMDSVSKVIEDNVDKTFKVFA